MKRAYLFILASFVWLIGGGIAISAFLDPKDESSLSDILMWSLLIGFSILFLIGTALWSRAKGYHPILGVILGWVGPLGLLILVFLPDKTRA
ncbi:MAG: hypothetical protein WD894_07875 [Pirellulales bacterium]